MIAHALLKASEIEVKNPETEVEPVAQEVPPQTTRRKVLSGIWKVLVGFQAVRIGVHFANSLSSAQPTTNQSLHRIINRVDGLMSHTNPFSTLVFYRNLLWAIKILHFAQVKKDQGTFDHKPTFVFKLGASHSGIEDFLYLGTDMCLEILRHCSPQILQHLIELNGNAGLLASGLCLDQEPPEDQTLRQKYLKYPKLEQVLTEVTQPSS